MDLPCTSAIGISDIPPSHSHQGAKCGSAPMNSNLITLTNQFRARPEFYLRSYLRIRITPFGSSPQIRYVFCIRLLFGTNSDRLDKMTCIISIHALNFPRWTKVANSRLRLHPGTLSRVLNCISPKLAHPRASRKPKCIKSSPNVQQSRMKLRNPWSCQSVDCLQ